MTPDQIPHRWMLARRDYLAGESAETVAARYGMTARTLHRRAAKEGWRRSDVADDPENDLSAHPMIWERPTLDGLAHVMPEIEPVIDRNTDDSISLLIHPTGEVLKDVAFRRAAECAAARKPREAAAWMRLLLMTERCDGSLVRRGRLLDSHDWFRAACIRSNWDHAEEEEDPACDPAS